MTKKNKINNYIKKITLTFFIFLSFFTEAQTKQVKLQIIQYTPYCGGIKPPKEMEEASKLPQPYANQTIIYKNKKGKVDSVRTNDSGIVVLNLKYGTYKVYENWRYYKSLPDVQLKNNFDKDCMKKEWAKTLISICVSKKSVHPTQTITIYNKCGYQQPCIIKSYLPE